MKKQTTLLLMFLLALLPSVFAVEDFTATTNPTYELCPCSGQGIPVLLTNTGDEASTYALSVNPEASTWVSISPNNFVLEPNQAVQVVLTVRSTCNIEGLLPTTLFISTGNIAKALSIDITFTQCYNHTLTSGAATTEADLDYVAYSGMYDVCADETTIIPVLLRNNDSQFNNEFVLGVTDRDWLSLDVAQTELAAGQDGLVLVKTTPTLDDVGEYKAEITSRSLIGDVRVREALDITVHDCYELAVEIEEKEEICAGVDQQLKATVTNLGRFDETVKLALDPEWAFTAESLFLRPGQEEDIIIVANAPADTNRKQTITLTAETNEADAADEHRLTVRELSYCYDPVVQANGKYYLFEEFGTSSFVIKNNGMLEDTYTVSVNAPEWVTVEGEREITLNPEETYSYAVLYKPNNVSEGKYDVQVTAASSVATVEKTITVVKKKQFGFVTATRNFVEYARYYIIIGLLLLLVLGFFLGRITKAFSKKKKEVKKAKVKKVEADKKFEEKEKKTLEKEAKQAEKEAKKPKSVHFYITLALIVVAVSLGVAISLFPTYFEQNIYPYTNHIILAVIGTVALIGIVIVAAKAIKKWRKK